MNSWLEVTHTYTKCYAKAVCLEQSNTGPDSEPKKCCPHIPKLLLQNTFQVILPVMAMTSRKSLFFMIAIKISKSYMEPTE